MKQKKMIVILGIVSLLGLAALSGLSTDYFSSAVPTSSAQGQRNPYDEINAKARANNANPSFTKSEELAGMLIEHFSVLDIPEYLLEPITEQVATANMNGASSIDENNIAGAINTLADQSSAPDYAYTNTEQVRVVRTFLHSLIPDVVKPNGNMTDLEAFAVFIATMSQKVDNDAFMVTPAEFTTSMQNPVSQPFPGTSAALAADAEAAQESVKANEMLGVIDGYVQSKQRLASEDIITLVGIY